MPGFESLSYYNVAKTGHLLANVVYKRPYFLVPGFLMNLQVYCTQSGHPKVRAPSALDYPIFPDPGSPSITKKKMTKTIEYTLDARTEGQYHTLYDGNQCHDRSLC